MTAGLIMRFPTFSASATDSRTTNSDGLQVIRNDLRKIFEVPHSDGVLIIGLGNVYIFQQLIEYLNSIAGRCGPMTVEATTTESLNFVNGTLSNLTGEADTSTMKRKIANAYAVNLIVFNSAAANLIYDEENSLVGLHHSEPILDWFGFCGTGDRWIDDYWAECENTDAYIPPQDEVNVDRVINFMARSIRAACQGSNTCGGHILVTVTDDQNVVREQWFTHADPNYPICFAPYHPEMDEPPPQPEA